MRTWKVLRTTRDGRKIVLATLNESIVDAYLAVELSRALANAMCCSLSLVAHGKRNPIASFGGGGGGGPK